MISISNLAKDFGDRTLFSNASFQLNSGERYGLVGANGSGKTTLLNIIAGSIDPTEGQVSIPKSLRLGVLKQDHFLYEQEEILAVAIMGNAELWDAMMEKERILAQPETEFDAERFSIVEETVQRLDGYTAEARAASVLEGLGLPAETRIGSPSRPYLVGSSCVCCSHRSSHLRPMYCCLMSLPITLISYRFAGSRSSCRPLRARS